MTRRGVILQISGVIILLLVPWFLVSLPRLQHIADDHNTQSAIESLREEADQLPPPVRWLGKGWTRFLRSSIHDWLTAQDATERSDHLNDINEAIAGLKQAYQIRTTIWSLLGLSTFLTGYLIRRNKGYFLALFIILFWLGGSPIPRKIYRSMPDDNDAILLAGMVPMLLALSIVHPARLPSPWPLDENSSSNRASAYHRRHPAPIRSRHRAEHCGRRH